MNVTVIGAGYVGLVTATVLAKIGHQVICLDKDEGKIEMLQAGKVPIFEPDLEILVEQGLAVGTLRFTNVSKEAFAQPEIILLAVGTPENADGSANLSAIFGACQEIADGISNRIIVGVKSTVPVGTNDKIAAFFKMEKALVEVVSNPEFLSQGTAVHDTLQAKRIVIGTESEYAISRMMELYAPLGQPMITMKRRSAEMVKYASNDFLALKISFINDIANLCECVEADIDEVVAGMKYDERIGKQFLAPGIGYGGSCFPKDTKALHWLAEESGYTLRTIQAAIQVNEKQKFKLIQAARKDVPQFSGKKIAVLGVAFKPGTDDLREAPAIPNIQYLLDVGAEVHVFDPVATANVRRFFGDTIRCGEDIASCLAGAEACFIFTEWPEIRGMDLRLFELMRERNVYDGRNCFDLADVEKADMNYYSIGRRKLQRSRVR
ncbi:UDP-glucose/GDP-mannose dehydrogenase family protein [Listeria rocourtiae]|uniref:UDP-glucose dehydrogenase family protein n=1 Tax=Listeria rocourtiae TaxID=647910 RepID=UPI001626970C|nr:UDP-glucose/GDP-mannose dehydrogenase family protein [Listeria rocourtiae]MBC1605511.1 UDP-glucose/GDP-mannose dehydrogenase family protein [Listeria rocourtiae]